MVQDDELVRELAELRAEIEALKAAPVRDISASEIEGGETVGDLLRGAAARYGGQDADYLQDLESAVRELEAVVESDITTPHRLLRHHTPPGDGKGEGKQTKLKMACSRSAQHRPCSRKSPLLADETVGHRQMKEWDTSAVTESSLVAWAENVALIPLAAVDRSGVVRSAWVFEYVRYVGRCGRLQRAEIGRK